MPDAYYNEWDAFAAAWLRKLQKAALIAATRKSSMATKRKGPLKTTKEKRCLKFGTIVRRAWKAYEDGGANYIEMIRTVRLSRPDRGLKECKDFADWMLRRDRDEAYDDMAENWCEEHWCEADYEHYRREHQQQEIAVIGTAPVKARASQVVYDFEEAKKDEAAATPKYKCKGCGLPEAECRDAWHRAARWLDQPGNYTKLMTRIDAGMPDYEFIPFAKREGEWLGVEAK